MAAVHILVSGVVQGVGYRMWTERVAAELGLCGWVRNVHDGRVEIHAEGPEGALARLVGRCHTGPRAAEVTGVAHRVCAPEDRRSFEMRPSSAAPEETS